MYAGVTRGSAGVRRISFPMQSYNIYTFTVGNEICLHPSRSPLARHGDGAAFPWCISCRLVYVLIGAVTSPFLTHLDSGTLNPWLLWTSCGLRRHMRALFRREPSGSEQVRAETRF